MILCCPHCAQSIDTNKIADDRLARFSDLIADGLTITEAARAVGISQQRGSSMMKKIAREMGEA